MKKTNNIAFIISISLILSSCIKDDIGNQIAKYTEIDEAAIQRLNSEQNLGLKRDDSGVYYKKVIEKPDGRVMNETFNVGIVYTMKTFDGKEVLSASEKDSILLNFYTSQSFVGFYNSLLLLKEGEKGIFYIPSPLAYQDQPLNGLNPWQPIILELEVPRIYNEEEQIVAYLERKKIQADTTTEEGLRAKFITKVPTGVPAKGKKNVSVKYTGSLLSGSVFDSGNFDFSLGLNSVIPGFEEAVLMLKVGEKAQFIFPSILGYGTRGSGQSIPPHAPLKFEIELTAINN